MGQTPAGWYPSEGQERYWDGERWTEQTRPLGGGSVPPPGPSALYGAANPPPKKERHTLRNVLLAIIAFGVLFIGGCFAIVGLAANEVGKEIDKAVEADSEPGGPDNPLKIVEGESFEVLGFEYAAGWRISDEFGFDVKGLKVTNNRDDKDSALVELKLWRGSEVLAVADCTTEPIAVGTTTSLSCISADDVPKTYDKITINDAF